jgi:DNA-binding transcriptional regulator LsrR (DeoR family)
MQSGVGFSDQNRLIAKVLHLYYMDNLSQVEIAKKLDMSTVRVNRLIKFARQEGMVEVTLKIPFPNLIELESRLLNLTTLDDVIITPTIGNNPDADLMQLTTIAASYLVNLIRSKDVICIGGGTTVSEIVNRVEAHRFPEVQILPSMGGVHNLKERDVNSIAARLARKLSGEAVSFFAPAFAESKEERETLYKLTHVSKVLEQARTARIGLFGVGSLQIDSSIIQYCSLPYRVLDGLVKQRDGVGEILGYVIDKNGNDCIPEVSDIVVGISLDELRSIPLRIGAALGIQKASAIAAAIKGKFFTTFFMDEATAIEVVNILESEQIYKKDEFSQFVSTSPSLQNQNYI